MATPQTEVRTPVRCDPERLLALMQAGDMRALDDLTRCYGDRLAAVGRRWCRDEADAEDAVQDALVSAGEHMTQFRGEGPVEGWLSRMVANACRRMRRGRKNDPALHLPADEARSLEAAGPTPEDRAERGEVAVALGELLLGLSAEDRTVLLLSEAEDWRAPEIAGRIGSTPGAVRTRLSRLRARLRDGLQDRRDDLL